MRKLFIGLLIIGFTGCWCFAETSPSGEGAKVTEQGAKKHSSKKRATKPSAKSKKRIKK